MKKSIGIIAAFILALSWAAWAEGGPAPAQAELNRVLEIYSAQSTALVEDNQNEAKVLADSLKRSLENSPSSKDPKDSAWEWEKKAMRTAAAEMATAKDLKSMRVGFASLSSSLAKAVERDGHGVQDTIYLMECPLALGDKAAIWIQESKKIANPYMGRSMPGCGGIKRVF